MKMQIILIASLMFFLSCSATNKMAKTENPKLVNKLLEENGNAFSVSSTHVIISYVWTYSESEITIYKLKKGRVINTDVHSIEKPEWITVPTKEEYFELDKCMELDGDMLYIALKNAEDIVRKDVPINIQCFTKGGYKKEFFNHIAKDIEKYKIRIQY